MGITGDNILARIPVKRNWYLFKYSHVGLAGSRQQCVILCNCFHKDSVITFLLKTREIIIHRALVITSRTFAVGIRIIVNKNAIYFKWCELPLWSSMDREFMFIHFALTCVNLVIISPHLFLSRSLARRHVTLSPSLQKITWWIPLIGRNVKLLYHDISVIR